MNSSGQSQNPGRRGSRGARVLLFGSLVLSLPPALLAQATATPPAEPEAETSEDTVILSPFEVVGDTTGYYSANSMSGTRFNTKIEDLATALTIVTKEQMSDFAMLDINDVFLYTAGTEGSGTYTDLTIDRNGSVQDNVQVNPTQANRVRGIAAANVSLNNIETMGRTPVDPSLIDALEISRGPNANVFGLGNPSGTLNQVPASANLTRNRTQVGTRLDSFGGYRASVDVNHVLIDNKLAVRANAVFQHEGFTRKPSGVDIERYNGMIKYQPFKSTTISAAYFYYHMYGTRPNAIPPRDNISYWIRSGRPTWNPVTRLISVNGTTLGPFGTTAAYNGPDYFSTGLIGGNSSQLYIDRSGLAYWSAPQGTTNTANPTLNLQTNWLVQTTGIEGAGGTAAKPSGQPLFTTTPTVSDKSIYDWSKINMAAINFVEDSNSTSSVQLDQIFINSPTQTLAIQIGAMREASKRYQRNLIGLANDNGQSGQLQVDVNERLLDGSVNPFFMRTFIATDRPRTVELPAKWDTYRGQLAYRLDLTREESALKWFGRLQFTTYYEYKYRINRQYSYRDANISSKSWIPGGTYRGTQGAPAGTPAHIRIIQGLQRYYVGDNQGNNVDYAPSTFDYGTYPFVWGNVATGVVNRDLSEIGLVGADKTGGTFNTKQIIKTAGAVAQSHLLDDRLVLTFGVREDKVFSQFGNPTTQFLNPDGITFNRAVTDGWDGRWAPNRGRTTNMQVVARPFQGASFTKNGNFFAQALGSLSVFYNESESFLPSTPAQDLPEDLAAEYSPRLLPNPTGEEESFGFGLNLLEGRLVVRVNHYENKQLNSRNGDANTIFQRVIRTDLPLIGATPARFMLHAVAGATVANAANFNRVGWIKVQNPTWTDAQVATELSRIMGMSTSVMNALINPTPPVAATNDIVAKGTEIEVNYNPTNYWTVSANVTDSRSTNRNISASLARYIDERMPIWTALRDTTVAATTANPNQLWWNTVYPGANANTGTAAQNFASFVESPYNVVKQLEGKSNPQVRRYNFRASTNFRLSGITEHNFWSKVNIGGALRWEDKGAIGYYGVQQSPAPITELDTSNPIYNGAHFFVDMFLGYRTRLWSDKVGTTIQLNARNLGESGRLQPVASFPDGTKNTYRIVDPAQYILSMTFDL